MDPEIKKLLLPTMTNANKSKRENMPKLIEEIYKLIKAADLHDRIIKSCTGSSHPREFEESLLKIVGSADELLYVAVSNFCKWRDESNA